MRSGTLKDSVTASLIVISPEQKQSKCPITDEWIDKMGSIRTVEYCSATKRSEPLVQATTWMNLKTPC